MPHVKIPVSVDITVADIAATIAAYDRIQVQRSTSGSAGPWEDITEADTEIRLITGINKYVWVDESGSPSAFYRYRFWNSTTSVGAAYSSAALGTQDPALLVLSVQELKELYLFGVDTSDDRGTPYPDAVFNHYIRAAVDWLEHRLDIPIKRTTVVEERHDFIREDYDKYIWLKLDHYPVISVESVKLVLPGETVVKTFEKDWIHIQRDNGQLQLVPGSGSAGSILLGASGAWLPFIYGGNRMIPDAFRVAYTAGFGHGDVNSVSPSNPRLDRVPSDVKHAVGMFAAIGPLNIAGDLIVGAGIASQSIGLDGLSQSISTTSSATNAGYGSRIIEYQKELKDIIPTLRRYYHGPSLSVV